MLLGGNIPQQPGVEGVIGNEVGVGGGYAVGDDAGKGRGFGQAEAQADGLPHPFPVARVVEIVVAQLRLHIGVVGGQAQFAGGGGVLQGRGHTETGGLVGRAALGIGKPAGQDLHIVAGGGTLGSVAQGNLAPGGIRVGKVFRFYRELQGDQGMVAQVLPHAGQVVDDRNGQAFKVFRRADAREQQQLGGSDGAAAEDDAVAVDNEAVAAAVHFHAHGFSAVKDDAADGNAGPEGQVQAVAGLLQVGDGGAHSDAVDIVHRAGADAGGVRVIHIRGFGQAGGETSLEKGFLSGQPFLAFVAAHRYGAGGTVKVAAEVQIGLDAVQVGHNGAEAPFGVAPRDPIVKVLRHRPQPDLAVDGAAAADDPAAGQVKGSGVFGAGFGPVAPHMRAGNGAGGVVAVLHIRGQLREVGIVGAGFEQQHRAGRVRGEAGSQYAAGGTGADDDDIVLHKGFSLAEYRDGAMKAGQGSARLGMVNGGKASFAGCLL